MTAIKVKYTGEHEGTAIAVAHQSDETFFTLSVQCPWLGVREAIISDDIASIPGVRLPEPDELQVPVDGLAALARWLRNVAEQLKPLVRDREDYRSILAHLHAGPDTKGHPETVGASYGGTYADMVPIASRRLTAEAVAVLRHRYGHPAVVLDVERESTRRAKRRSRSIHFHSIDAGIGVGGGLDDFALIESETTRVPILSLGLVADMLDKLESWTKKEPGPRDPANDDFE